MEQTWLDRPTDTGAEHTGSGMQAAKEKAEHLSGRAKEKTADLKRQVEQMVDDVRDRAHPTATDQKKQQYGRMKGIAHAVRAASDDLSNQGQPMVAEYSRDVAEGLESMAQSLGRRDVDALVGSVEDFARAPSVALLGGAVVGGFAPACFFMKNSARWRHQRSDDIRQSYAASSGGRNRDGGAEHINCGDAPLGDGYGQQREGAV